MDRVVGPATAAAIDRHLAYCASCRQSYARERQLRTALRGLPVVGPTPGFFDQALKVAEIQHRRHHRHWLRLGFGGGLAAGLALWLVTGWLASEQPGGDHRLAEITVTANQVHTINLAINARHELHHARLTISLPAGMELTGFPGRHKLSWHTDLKAGNNLLQLPLIAHGVAGGVLIARIEHQNQNETLEINMAVRAEHQSGSVLLPMNHA